MLKKPNGRFLLTWNEKKHPEVVEFFDSVEQGMYAHSIRKAIKFYMEHKENRNDMENNRYNTRTICKRNSSQEIDDEIKNSLNAHEYEEINPASIVTVFKK